MRPITSFYDFTGKVVVITGGSRGIGHAMALGFATAGARVAVASRKIESCQATVKEIRALGSDGSAHATHVGKWDDCNRLAEEVYARWGRADVLINNAGLSPLAPSSLATSEDLFDKIIAVNLKGPFRLTALFASRMAQGEGGSIINISSTASIRPNPETAPYGCAKAGLNILTVAAAKEFALSAARFIPTLAKAGRARPISRSAQKRLFPCSAQGNRRKWWAPRCISPVRRPASLPAPSSLSMAARRTHWSERCTNQENEVYDETSFWVS